MDTTKQGLGIIADTFWITPAWCFLRDWIASLILGSVLSSVICHYSLRWLCLILLGTNKNILNLLNHLHFSDKNYVVLIQLVSSVFMLHLALLPQFQFCFIPLLQNILDLLFNVWNCIDRFAREEMQTIYLASWSYHSLVCIE